MAVMVGVLETGIANLDRILGGGLPEGDVVLVSGPPGSGKTTLCFQLAFHVAAAGRKVIYVSTLAEPPTRLVRHLRSLRFFDESVIGKQLVIEHMYPVVKSGLEPVVAALVAAVREHDAALLIIDGLDPIRDIHANPAKVRTFLYELAAELSTLACTTILTTTGGGIARSPEDTMSDVLVFLDQRALGPEVMRTIQLQKVRGQAPLLGVHAMRLDSEGLRIFPRVETRTTPSRAGLSTERRAFGLDELDAMMHGGLVAGSMTLVAGAAGTGKTLLGLQYMLAGAERGERGLIIGLRESPRLLCDKLRAFGLDLETPLRRGLITMHHHPPIQLMTDQIFDEMLQMIERRPPERVLVDSLVEIEHAIPDERRRRSTLVCFAELMRGHGITTVVTRDTSQRIGPELDFENSPIAVLGENVILLRYVDFRGHLHRVLSILAMRDSPYDPTIRTYRVGGHGIEVFAVRPGTLETVAGIARLPSERRVKRQGNPAPREGES